MQAEIIAVGSELLGPARLDTNSLYLALQLQQLGVEVGRKAVLPDRVDDLAEAISAACRRSPLVFTTGGLGPTEDDITVPAAARALGVALQLDDTAVRRLRWRFRKRHLRFTANNLRQAMRLSPARWLPNSVGSAMGQWCPTPLGHLVLLPGPPPELHRMVSEQVLPRLVKLVPRSARFTRVLSLVGLGESQVDALAAPIYSRVANPSTTILVTAPQQVELHFTAIASTLAAAQARADRLASQVARRMGNAVFSREQNSLAATVGGLLRQKEQTLAVAESCTGGLLGASLTQAPGASDFFLGGVLSYADSVKLHHLGVPAATLRRYGAVSAPTAAAMATGVCRLMGSDWGVSITGVAGPSGGSRSKPVGTVFVGLCGTARPVETFRLRLSGDRDRIRASSVQLALNQLRLALQ